MKISGGVKHKMPKDLQETLVAKPRVLLEWEDITPLARNEWLCWIESAKLEETRERRIRRTVEDLKAGKRRPCCWGGCPHR
jgi:uncharacterized protein YdeI (YjbR/CyaY-like superfamily)